MGEGVAGAREGDRIVLAQFDGAPGQTRSLGHLLRAVMRPAIDLAPDVTPGRHAICRRVVRVELDRLVEQAQRLVDGPPRSEERRVGEGCVSRCRSRGSAYP